MKQVTYYFDHSILHICLNGQITTANAQEAEQEIMAIRQSNPDAPMVLDAEHLDLITSSGLRIILRLRKSESELKIINVSSSIYEILEMTGFTEMLTVEKAYRRLSVEGCEIIGRGANGAVYRYDEETIVKVYHNPDALPEIHQERELARKAFILGINTAIPYDVVRVGDSYGTVAELLNAVSLSSLVIHEPENFDAHVALFVDFLKKIHDTKLPSGQIPDIKKDVTGWIHFLQPHLPEDQWQKLLDLVMAVPERSTMMHGDYHTNNIMIQNGETLLIDMDTLCTGHPIFELSFMFNAFEGFSEVDHTRASGFFGFSHETSVRFFDAALQKYLNTEDLSLVQELKNKTKILGYVRMLRRALRRGRPDDADSQMRIARCKEQLAVLLPQVDSLDF